MTTRMDRTPEVQHSTHVDDMPPLAVTTVGIPLAEHLGPRRELPPTVVDDEHRSRRYALAISGVLAGLAVFALVWGTTFAIPQQAPVMYPGYGTYGSTMSEWPPAVGVLPPSTVVPSGQQYSEWPARLTAPTDGYGQWGSTTSEWPPRG